MRINTKFWIGIAHFIADSHKSKYWNFKQHHPYKIFNFYFILYDSSIYIQNCIIYS